jgi:hypothetical protein
LVAGLCVCLTQLPSAVGGDKTGGKTLEVKDSKTGTSAEGVSFTKELGVSYPSLLTLAGRIEQARQAPDPIALAAAARELAAAEVASGKTAAVKSDDLIKEAIDLAKARSNPTEMKAVAALVGAKAGQDLRAAIPAAEKWAAKVKADREAGVKTRGITGQLHADSRYGRWITVHVNGRNVGSMPPMGDIYTYVGDSPWGTTFLYARAHDGRWWRAEIRGNYNHYHWILR